MAYYKISAQTLTDIANAVRSKIGRSEEIPCAELAEAIASIDIGEVVLESAGVAFSSQKVDPDVNYKVGRNWLADLVSVVQKMAGKKSDMTLEDMLYWLNRVQFIPQGNAESSFSLSFSSSASGILPDVQIGTAESAFTLSFSSNVSGYVLQSELTGAKVYYNDVLLPGIPEDILARYPYACIHKTATYYYLLFGTGKVYYAAANDNYPNRLLVDGENANYRIKIDEAETADSWALRNATKYYWEITTEQKPVWSNHDIPSGSADATSVYFAGSEPVAVKEVE